MPPDANDYLKQIGEEGLRAAIDRAAKVVPLSKAADRESHPLKLELGSDLEIAERVRSDLLRQFGHVLSWNDRIYAYAETHWQGLDMRAVVEAISKFDGALFPLKKGYGRIKLSLNKVKSILGLLIPRMDEPGAFDTPTFGVSCQNGFLCLENGKVELRPHAPKQKCLATLPIPWREAEPPSPDKRVLLDTLLNGIFDGDPEKLEKIQLIEELVSLALFGGAMSLKSPKSVVFYGESAGNGKSQVLKLISGLVPNGLKTSLTPAQMSDEKLVVGLAGVRLNAADEIGGKAIYSERFKAIVTGEPVTGRGLYVKQLTFSSKALNVFTTNDFPTFTGAMGPGVRRRLLPVSFKRTIPEENRIAGIADLIVEHEAEALLAMAVRGALRVQEAGALTEPASSNTLLAEWVVLNDPVEAWLRDPDAVMLDANATQKVLTKEAYRNFKNWCNHEGILPSQQLTKTKFTQMLGRSRLVGPVKHTNKGNSITGLILNPGGKR
jgi:phage/plasmid-associated DNA primase